MLARHRGLDDGLLKGALVLIGRFRPEGVESEESLQFSACIVVLAAPCAAP